MVAWIMIMEWAVDDTLNEILGYDDQVVSCLNQLYQSFKNLLPQV